MACKDCSVGKFNNVEGRSNCEKCDVGKFNNLEGDQTVKIVMPANSIWKVNRTKQLLVKIAVSVNTLAMINRLYKLRCQI